MRTELSTATTGMHAPGSWRVWREPVTLLSLSLIGALASVPMTLAMTAQVRPKLSPAVAPDLYWFLVSLQAVVARVVLSGMPFGQDFDWQLWNRSSTSRRGQPEILMAQAGQCGANRSGRWSRTGNESRVSRCRSDQLEIGRAGSRASWNRVLLRSSWNQ